MGTTVKLFKKKPVVIAARQIPANGEVLAAWAVAEWITGHGWPWLLGDATRPETLTNANENGCGIWIDPADGMLMIRTLEGDMKVGLGDWVIRGVKGEFYPCKPDIFEQTYELITKQDLLDLTEGEH